MMYAGERLRIGGVYATSITRTSQYHHFMYYYIKICFELSAGIAQVISWFRSRATKARQVCKPFDARHLFWMYPDVDTSVRRV